MKRVLWVLGGTLVLAPLLFGWGFLSHRERIVPYHAVRAAAQRTGIVAPDTGTNVKEMLPATPQLGTLMSLPYVRSRPDERSDRSGVLAHEGGRAMDGVNFYSSYGKSAAYLIDMDGRLLHEWSYDHDGGAWFDTRLLPDGSILVVVEHEGVLKLDRESRLLWSFEARAHHDLAIDDVGNIYVLASVPVRVPEIYPSVDVLDEKVIVLTAEGVRREEFSLLEVLRRSPYAFLLPSARQLDLEGVPQVDLLHANHLEVLDGSQSDKSHLFRRGNILVSLKHLNVIMILDGNTREILWLWGPNNLALQHHPVLLENGRILLFDNGTERSRLLSVDPTTLTVGWHYEAEDFFSDWGGSSQRLENGNTLITVTATGYVHEITPGGEIVWSFANPVFDEEGRYNIWRMTRFSGEQVGFLGP